MHLPQYMYKITLLLLCTICRQIFESDHLKKLLIVQCNFGNFVGDLIACARYRLHDIIATISCSQTDNMDTHVLFIIHLPSQEFGSSYVGFQGDPWVSANIDCLTGTNENLIPVHKAIEAPISELFSPKKQQCSTLITYDTEGTEQAILHMDLLSDEENIYKDESYMEDISDLRRSESLSPSSSVFDLSFLMPLEEEQSSEDEVQLCPVSDDHHGALHSRSIHEPVYYYCQRLYGCIQAAVSLLQGEDVKRSTQRVLMLLKLIPMDGKIGKICIMTVL